MLNRCQALRGSWEVIDSNLTNADAKNNYHSPHFTNSMKELRQKGFQRAQIASGSAGI